MINTCGKCKLGQRDGVQVVQGRGPRRDCVAMLIGEAPGRDENTQGRPFVGLSGEEQDNYIRLAGGNPRAFYITNVVRCWPDGNRDPRPDEIAACQANLFADLYEIKPRVVGTVGAIATRWMLGAGIDMEHVHGIPIHITYPIDAIVVPIYHPSYGLHSTRHMTFIKADYQALMDTIRDNTTPRELDTDDSADAVYEEVKTPEDVRRTLAGDWEYVAVDTEDKATGGPLYLQYSIAPKTGYLIRAENTGVLSAFAEITRDKTFIIQNAPHDLPVLREMGIHITKHLDTMIMAYLLQDEPRGLKALGYRHLRYAMQNYMEVIRPAENSLVLMYIARAAASVWPEDMAKKSQSRVASKARRILVDYRKNQELDIAARWKNICTDYAEATLGPLPHADLSMISPRDAIRYACRDADATLQIFHYLWPRIEAEGLEHALDIDIGIQPLISDMMTNGMLIDREYFRALATQFDAETERLTAEINAAYEIDCPAAEPINPGSPKQVGVMLHSLGVLPAANMSTDEEELTKRAHKHKVIPLVLEYREVAKLRGTYAEALPAHADANNCIHARISQITTATGRLATSDPNIQNIPTATELGRKIKAGFIPEPGCVLLSSDYSQIEMRLLAHLSRDPRLIDIFLRGVDIHAQTAAWMWGIPIEQVTKDQRYKAKRIGFGIVYCISAPGLQRQMEMAGVVLTRDECQHLIDMWYDIYGGVREYMNAVAKEARTTHMVRMFTGRLRRIPETYSRIPQIVSAGIRQACNAPVQGGAGDIIKIAMANLRPVYAAFQRRGVCKPIDQIHDDLMDMVQDNILMDYVRVKGAIMENSTRLCVPLKVEHKAGRNWRDMGVLNV